MKLFDVYPLFDINIVKEKVAMYGMIKVQNTSTCMAVMLSFLSVMHIRIM